MTILVFLFSQHKERDIFKQHLRMNGKEKAAVYGVTLGCWLLIVAAGIVFCSGRPGPGAFLPLAWFDKIFRAVGPLIPIVIIAARFAVQYWSVGMFQSNFLWRKNLIEPLVFYFCMSVLRLLIYWTHLRIERSSLMERLPPSLEEPGHILSDHIVLGSSVIAILQVEAVFLFQEWKKRQSTFSGYQEVNQSRSWRVPKFAGLKLVIFIFFVLFGLTAFDMFFTALYFHPRLQSSLGLLTGLIAFHLPASLFVWYRL